MAMNIELCRVRVRSKGQLVRLADCPAVGIDIRLNWVNLVGEAFRAVSGTPNRIRPWDIVLKPDGTIQLLAVEPSGGHQYAARFRAPSDMLEYLNQAERVGRAERFALGSLFYELMSGRKPFEGVDDTEILRLFSRREYPLDVFRIEIWPMIFACWNFEIPDEVENLLITETPGYARRLRTYISEHPVLFTVQAVGAVLSVVSLTTGPILAIAGFTSVGPAAGTAAAAWQSSMGIVEAGSLFAWCQSAAMGGAAAQGIAAAGTAGTVMGLAGGLGRFIRRENRPPQA